MWIEKFFYMDEAGGDGSDGGGGSGGDAGTSDADAVAAAVSGGQGDAGNGSEGGQDNGWSFSDSLKGEGDKPEWFKDDKYKTVSEQAKAYNELHSKFGSFTGAPESYEVALSAELTEKGMTIDAEDTMVTSAIEFAKKSGMNQEGFNNLINLYGEVQLAQNQADEEQRADEMKALGSTAEKRVGNLEMWGKANLSQDLYQGFEEMIQSAAGVSTLEKMIALTRAAPMDGGDPAPSSVGSVEELNKLQFATDDHGNRLINTDPAHKAKYQEMRDAIYGSGDHNIIVGGPK